LQASDGDVIALLDQDDFYHPEKLETHVKFLELHPEIGFTYNARFELNYSSKTIRDIWRPPREISLEDLVIWFPISPSDVVFRREWALKIEWLGQRRGAEIAQFGNLFLAGCKFGFINRALNYRRYHSGRVVSNLLKVCENEISNQVMIFEDSRFPSELLGIRNLAHANLYVYWAYHAFVQDETNLGQEFIRKAIQLNPEIIVGEPGKLISQFLINCVDDENLDHETLMNRLFAQLPIEISSLSKQSDWAVAEGYLLKGARAAIWGRYDDGRQYLERAGKLNAQIDDYFLQTLTHKLLDYEIEFGSDASQDVLNIINSLLQNLSGGKSIRLLVGNYFINRAFQHYSAGEYASVRSTAIHAILKDPKYLMNRGVLSILSRSILKSLNGSPTKI